MLISQDRPLVEEYTRQPDGGWRCEAVEGLDGTVALPAIGCTLRLADVYRRVRFEGADMPAPPPG